MYYIFVCKNNFILKTAALLLVISLHNVFLLVENKYTNNQQTDENVAKIVISRESTEKCLSIGTSNRQFEFSSQIT